MTRTVAHLLTAAAVALGSVAALTTATTPAQAANPHIACSNPGNGELCLHIWSSGRVAVSYKKIRGPRIIGRLTWWTPIVGEREVLHDTHMDAGRTYSGYRDYRPDKCYIGYLYYRSRPQTPWQTAKTSSC